MLTREAEFRITILAGFPQPSDDAGTDFKNKAGEATVKVVDVLLNDHFDPKIERPTFPKYFFFGNKQYQYASHCMNVFRDCHDSVRVNGMPVSDLLLDYGFKATVKDPQFNQRGLRANQIYDVEFVGENGVICDSESVEIVETIWFDNEEINDTTHPM